MSQTPFARKTRVSIPWSLTLVYFDGTGVCLLAKRLEDGKFCWPRITDGVVRLTAAQLQALLEGFDWRRVHDARETRARSRQVDSTDGQDAGKALECMIESAS